MEDGELMDALTRRNSAPGADAIRDGRDLDGDLTNEWNGAASSRREPRRRFDGRGDKTEHESVRQERTVK